jgi:hypothetical protein
MVISPPSRCSRAGIPTMLDDYVRHGTEPDPADAAGAARRLSFRPEIEAEIYSTVPHRLVPYLRTHPPGGPIAFIAGTRSREVGQVGLAATRGLTGVASATSKARTCSPSRSRTETTAPCSTG